MKQIRQDPQNLRAYLGENSYEPSEGISLKKSARIGISDAVSDLVKYTVLGVVALYVLPRVVGKSKFRKVVDKIL